MEGGLLRFDPAHGMAHTKLPRDPDCPVCGHGNK